MLASPVVASEVSGVAATGAEPPLGGPPPGDGTESVPAAPPPDRGTSRAGRAAAAVVIVGAAVGAVWFGQQRGEGTNLVAQIAATHALGAVSGAPAASSQGYRVAAQVFPDLEPFGGWRPVGRRTDRIEGRDLATLIYQHAGRRVTLSLVAGEPVAAPAGARRIRITGVPMARQTRDGRAIVSWTRRGQTAVLTGVGIPARQLYSLAVAMTSPNLAGKIPQKG